MMVDLSVCLCAVQVFIFAVDNNMLRIVSEVAGKEVRSHFALASFIQNNGILNSTWLVYVCCVAGILLRLQRLCGGSER